MDKIDEEMQAQLKATLEAGVSDEAMKGLAKRVQDVICEIEDDIMYRLKDDIGHNLAAYAGDMAAKAVNQLLEGNEEQMRRYLSCEKRGEDGEYYGWNGRSGPHNYYPREISEQHPVIHGTLHEQGFIALRKKIVEAHRDLITSERILDLEDQVASLVAQNNKQKAEMEKLHERLRYAA